MLAEFGGELVSLAKENGVCIQRGFGTERSYIKKNR